MKIDINPVPAWRAAPIAARLTAAVLYLTSLVIFVSAVTRNAFGAAGLSDVQSQWWYLLGGIFLAYVATDTALLTLRGRSSSVVMSLIFFIPLSGLAAYSFYDHFVAGHFVMALAPLALALVWLFGIYSLFTAGARDWRAKNKISLLGDAMKSRKGGKAPQVGSKGK